MATAYCENDPCEAEAVEVVPVSVDADTVEFRRLCYPCSEAYNTGAQHGLYRSGRQLRAHAESLREQGFVTEAGVIFCALPKLDAANDPGEEGLEPPTLDADDEEFRETPCAPRRLNCIRGHQVPQDVRPCQPE